MQRRPERTCLLAGVDNHHVRRHYNLSVIRMSGLENNNNIIIGIEVGREKMQRPASDERNDSFIPFRLFQSSALQVATNDRAGC